MYTSFAIHKVAADITSTSNLSLEIEKDVLWTVSQVPQRGLSDKKQLKRDKSNSLQNIISINGLSCHQIAEADDYTSEWKQR